MPLIAGGQIQSGLDREDLRFTLKGIYSFAALGRVSAMGGAQGAINLKDEHGHEVVLPDNFVVERATVNTLTALTSGGAATVAVGSTEAGKAAIMLAATAFDAAPFDSDAKALHCAALVTTPYKVTGSGKKLAISIATADLTAGAFEVVLHGYQAAG
jgi:hypothetical protein